ncbi:MAG: PP2C family protein-serine/threonine phosphatase [Peptostreptococcaceae bacterium]|nr:PP2C family protein-serine/threonine phosphatase [Peptostreptococcaceae bacterium]
MPKERITLRNSIRYKYTLGLILFAILLSLSASAIGYFEFQANFEKQYIERAYTIGKLIESQIDGDNIEMYFKDAVYQPAPVTEKTLKSLWNDMDVLYIYLANPEASRVHFIFVRGDAPTDEMMMDIRLDPSGTQDYFVIREPRRTIGVNVPVRNNSGKIVGVLRIHVSLIDMGESLYRYVIEAIILNLMLASVITLIYISYVRKNVVSPIEVISRRLIDFAASGYKEVPYIPQSAAYDEIGKLARSVSQMTYDIKDYIDDIQNNVIEKEKMTAELRVARDIQASLLPTEFPKNDEIDLYALMDSAKEVGGDFYDFFYTDSHQLTVIIGDVSGKGIPAALFMTNTKEIIKNRTTDGNAPYRIMEIANKKLIKNSNDRTFVTVWLGKINLESGELTYVSAGHPTAMIRRKDKNFEPMEFSQNMILAAFDDTSYKQTTILLEEGDVIFLYTDGVIDAEKDEEAFGEKRLLESLDRNFEKSNNMEEFVKSVREEIGVYEEESDQKDDVTMLAFRYNGNANVPIDHLL